MVLHPYDLCLVLHYAALLTPPHPSHPRGLPCSTASLGWRVCVPVGQLCRAELMGRLEPSGILCVCGLHAGSVYRTIAALPSQHQHHTHCQPYSLDLRVPLQPATTLATSLVSDWGSSAKPSSCYFLVWSLYTGSFQSTHSVMILFLVLRL